MIMLLVLTLLGITAAGSAGSEQQMAGNIQENYRAFQAAESALSDAMNTTGILNASRAAVISKTTSALSANSYGTRSAGAVYTITYQYGVNGGCNGTSTNEGCCYFRVDALGVNDIGITGNLPDPAKIPANAASVTLAGGMYQACPHFQ